MFLTGKRSPFLGEMKNSVVKLGLDSALGPLHLALCTWPFALGPLPFAA